MCSMPPLYQSTGDQYVQRFLAGQCLVVVGIHIAQEVPAGAGPLGHGVRFALGRAAAAGAGGVDPVGHLAQGAFAVVGGLVALHLRQHQRQLLLRQRHPAALLAVHQGDGLAPVALAGEHPVAQLVVDLLLAEALLHHVFLHGGDGLLDGHAVEEAGVDHNGAVVLATNASLVTSPPATTSMMGRPNFLANSQSRWSWPGTPMTMPVP